MRTLLIAATLAGFLAACGQQADTPANTTDAVANRSDDKPRDKGRRERRADRPRGFLRADADRDGVVTVAEVEREAETRFARLDADGDGTASAEEQASRRGGGGRRRAQQGGGDANAAEPVTRAAFIARARTRFDRRDRDSDGRLSGAELGRGGGRERGGQGERGREKNGGEDAADY
jgi:hypothetical protein